MNRWYPTLDQVKDPESLHRTLKQVLDQHYSQVDRMNTMHTKDVAPGAPDTSGPATTKFLGLNVTPVDTQTLADGATLKFDKKSGTFKFS